MPRLLAPVVGAALALALAGCSSSVLLGVPQGDAPAAPTATPSPAPESTAEPVVDVGCDHVRITEPGNYLLGDCATVTLEGTGIDVTAAGIGQLLVRGDRLDVVAETIDDLRIEGQGNEIEAGTIDRVDLRGERNEITADDPIGVVTIDGNENVVASDGGVDTLIDNGLLNEVD